MDIRPIRTDDDHTAALREIERLWDAPEGSPDADKMDVLATLVDAYESRRWPIEPSTPRDMLVYACGDMGRSQAELAELLGSRSQASDLLSGRQRISLEVAHKISAAWAIPIQLLVAPYEQALSTFDHERTVTAFFDKRVAADKAMAGVVGLGVPSAMASIVEGHGGGTGGQGEGFWESVKNLFAPEEDKHSYAEGLSRGGYLLTVHTSEAHYDRVLDILDHEGAVDMNERETQWRLEGWGGTHATAPALGTSTAAGYGTASTGMETTGMASGAVTTPVSATGTTGMRTGAGTLGTGTLGTERGVGTEDGTIQLAEETLRVGKRDVNHGRVRLRSYVVEKPVNESVSLHSERVDVARHAVDRSLTAGENLLADRTLTAEEHDEEAVVSKEARVYEEVWLGKTAQDRTQEIHDTVRRTEVEVDDARTAGTARTGVAATGGGFDATTITEHMPVLGSDGEHVGTVDHLDGMNRIKLTKNDSSNDKHHFIPMDWIERVDTHVRLKRSAADTRSEWMKV